MKTKNTVLFLSVIVLSFFSKSLKSQTESSIDIRFIGARFTDTLQSKSLRTLFLVDTRDTSSFPPSIKLPPKCSVFENGREKVVLLGPQNLAVSLWGDDVELKDKTIYDLVKNKVNLKGEAMKHCLIIVYDLKENNFTFHKMSLTPGFGEKKGKQQPVEKRIEFEVEKL